jgi:hypothetical protein
MKLITLVKTATQMIFSALKSIRIRKKLKLLIICLQINSLPISLLI